MAAETEVEDDVKTRCYTAGVKEKGPREARTQL